MNGTVVHDLLATSWRIEMPHTAAAVPVARALVRTALGEVEHAADSDTAELLTAELVTNAVQHTVGDAPIELVVELLPTGCLVEVHDPDPVLLVDLSHAVDQAPDTWQESGRRLLLDASGRVRSPADGPAVVRQPALVSVHLPLKRSLLISQVAML
ncbi:ATP-binding protein [Streptomyces sp. NPDC050743]|uniref:ATP-binding protein n=1 Tax=Streptomyces sp. NPDC050743 TaxID=3365634 RepID=UPI00378E815A